MSGGGGLDPGRLVALCGGQQQAAVGVPVRQRGQD